jgi:hypothetical protein
LWHASGDVRSPFFQAVSQQGFLFLMNIMSEMLAVGVGGEIRLALFVDVRERSHHAQIECALFAVGYHFFL